MILVIGANGNVGGHVVEQLLEAQAEVRVLVRDPTKAARFQGRAEIVAADLSQPETLRAGFAGVAKVFMVTQGPEQLETNAIEAAKVAGVGHIVKLSSMGFGPTRDALAVGNWHRAVEARLAASGMAWTILLAGGFATNALGWAAMIKSQGAVFAPTGEGKVAVVDPRDLAASAVATLTRPGHEGKRYELTGPSALSAGEQVALIGEAIGKPLRFVDAPPEAARDGMLGSGMPAPMVERMLEVLAAIKAGGAATVSPDVERLLGRKPRTFAAWARDNAAAFR